jgi:hypothetical protein
MRRWDAIRFALGMTQMAAATIAVVLLFLTGITTWSLVAAVLACVLTTASVLLFGMPRHARPPRPDASSRSNL